MRDESPNTGNTTRSRWVMPIVYTNIVLYALCYQLQRPIEPFLVDRLIKQRQEDIDIVDVDESDVMASYGRLQSFFSFIQTLGSPFVGFLLDRIGSRNCFVVVFLSSALSYWLLANTNSMSMLYFSKVPTVFQAAFLVAQAIVTTNISKSHAADRAAALGRLTTAYTIGATVGPALGGIIGASGDYFFGAKMAVVGSLLSAILALLLPNKQQSKAKENSQPSVFTDAKTPLRASYQVIAMVWQLLTLKFLSSVTNSMVNTSIPILLKQQGFNEADLGWNMSSTFVAVAIVSGIAMKPLTARFGSYRLTYVSLFSKAMFVVVLALISVSNGRRSTLIITVFLTCSAHVLATAITLQTTGSVDVNEQGTLLGIEHSLFALARVFGPSLGMKIMVFGGFKTVAFVCCLFDMALATFAMTYEGKEYKDVSSESVNEGKEYKDVSSERKDN